MATSTPYKTMISSEDVQGTDVYSPSRDKIGDIDHLMIEKQSGRVVYAVMSFGGFLGLGQSHFPVPWGTLSYDTSLGGYITNITEDQLRNAPSFSDDSFANRDWEQKVHRHYNAPPYWMSSNGL